MDDQEGIRGRLPGDPAALRALLEQTEARRAEAEAALRESEERHRQMAEAIPEVFWMSSLDMSQLFYISPAYEKIWGRRCADLYQRPTAWLDAIHPEDRPQVAQALEQRWRTGELDVEYRIVRPDGTVRWIHDRTFPVRNEAGEVYRVVGVAADITERKRAEEEKQQLKTRVQQAQHQKVESLAQLAGGIAHDFNNLLTAILGFAGLAKADLPAGSTAGPMLDEVEKAARRAADLTHQMLAYSGKGCFVLGPIDLSALLRELEPVLQAAVPPPAGLTLVLASAPCTIEADRAQIGEVIHKLVSNAAEALDKGSGSIAIRTGMRFVDRGELFLPHSHAELSAGNYAYLEVEDTGCGMSEETVARIFDPFFTTKFTGRGLSLAAVLGIVRGHRGTIQVASTPGQGSTFRVLFPCAVPAAVAEPVAAADDCRRSGTILVIEDEEGIRTLAQRILEESGFTVLLAGDGLQGAQLFRQHAAEIAGVVLDLTMPRQDGLETLRELRRVQPKVRVLLTSGYAESDVMSRFAGEESAGFLQKPFTPAALCAAVRRTLES